MTHFKKSFVLLVLITAVFGSLAFTQDLFSSRKTQKSVATIGEVGNGDSVKHEPVTKGATRSCNPALGSSAVAWDLHFFDAKLRLQRLKDEERRQTRAKEVMLDNEYTETGYEQGHFYDNPLLLDGKPLDYADFNLASTGEMAVIKGAPNTGQSTSVPFYVYLRRNGNKVLIPGKADPDPKQIKIDLGEIIRYAESGDELVIEAVNKEDGSVKRILKLLGMGC